MARARWVRALRAPRGRGARRDDAEERSAMADAGDVGDIATLEQAAGLLHDRTLTARELTERCLARIAAVDDVVRAFVTVTPERAREDARTADARLDQGDPAPLLGIPIGLKDLVATRGIRTTAGSRVLDDWIPDEDAPVAVLLAEAGTVLLGKTNTHEFAWGTFTPPTRNPWDIERVPGGSSGGSAAAVAVGECLGALGTDTGGSIRIPSACCGVTGFKPTQGVVSTEDIVPLSWSLDHAGPIARSVRDCALLLDALTGYELFEPLDPLPGNPNGGEMSYADAADDVAARIAGLRLGVPSGYFFDHVMPDVVQAVRAAVAVLAGLGAEVVEVAVPDEMDALFGVYRAIQRPEAHTAHLDAGWYPARADRYTPATRAALERGAQYTVVDFIHAQRARQAFAADMEDVLAEVDALLTPTLPIAAPRVADLDHPLVIAGREEEAGLALLRLTFPFNLSGQPALTVPCGFDGAGMPIGLQIAGRRFDDATVLRLGHAYQLATDWHLRRPAL
jgi:aspartyl-tRNA(Asn)/glutamyl-tRNA(Gln) amidotransferase subunit A